MASAVSGSQPPAGPSFPIRAGRVLQYPVRGRNTDFERHLCVGREGFTLHAATRAGGADCAGREALLKYILRPTIAQERLLIGHDGLVRITLKRAFSDGTVAVDIDPHYRCCRGLPRPYRPRAELLKQTFHFDVLHGPSCHGGFATAVAIHRHEALHALVLRGKRKCDGQPAKVPR